MALLFLLHDLREGAGLILRVLHFHHQLRGPDADGDESFVKDLAGRLGLEFSVQRADVRRVAEEKGRNLEDEARRLRYAFFEKVVVDGLVDPVAVAHTADDQAETVLMHLLRGSGLGGLGGIHPVLNHVVRPALDVRREELRAYLRSRDETWREDATNQDSSRFRARVRHKLLPLLEAEFQPSVAERLASVAELARQDDAFLRRAVEACYEMLAEDVPDGVGIDAEDLLDPAACLLPADCAGSGATGGELSGRLVRRMIQAARKDLTRITAGHVESVLKLARSPQGGTRVDLPSLTVEKRFGKLFFSAATPGADSRTIAGDSSYHYVVELPAATGAETMVGSAGHRLRLKAFDWLGAARDTKSGAHSLDRELLAGPTVLRSWQPGDAYQPHGRRHSHKLKRLFWEKGVPVRERASWPVLTCGERIVWARVFGVAAEFAASDRTRTGVMIIEDKA